MTRSPFFQSLAGTCSLVLAAGFLFATQPTAAQAAPLQGVGGDTAFQGQVSGGPSAGPAGEMTTRYQPTAEPDTDRLVVKFKDGVDGQEQAQILNEVADATAAVDTAEVSHETVEQAQVVDLQQMIDPVEQAQVVDLLEAQPEVEYAEPDLIITSGQAATPPVTHLTTPTLLATSGICELSTRPVPGDTLPARASSSVSLIPGRPGTLS